MRQAALLYIHLPFSHCAQKRIKIRYSSSSQKMSREPIVSTSRIQTCSHDKYNSAYTKNCLAEFYFQHISWKSERRIGAKILPGHQNSRLSVVRYIRIDKFPIRDSKDLIQSQERQGQNCCLDRRSAFFDSPQILRPLRSNFHGVIRAVFRSAAGRKRV